MANVLKLGARVELIRAGKSLDSPDIEDSRLVSSIQEVIDEDTIIISNPTIKARLIPMHPHERYEAYFFIGSKIYNARVTITNNLTEGRMRTVKVSIDTSIEKYERRQYYRFETTMDVRYLLITPDNAAAFKEAVKSNTLLKMDGFKPGKTLDISGGGIRYSSDEELPKNGMVIAHLVADTPNGLKNYIFLGKVLVSSEIKGIRGKYQHRMQFVDLKQDAREEFVQFIFHCEREQLRNRVTI